MDWSPLKIISSLLAVGAFVTMVLAVDSTYARKAWASSQFDSMIAQASIVQERDKIEIELQLINLELSTLEGQTDERTLERKEYLKTRRAILESRLVDLSGAT